MKKIGLLGILLIALSTFSFGQTNQYEIKVKLTGVGNDKQLYLARYFGNNQYIKVDSAINTNGVTTFKGKEALKGGIYLIVLSKEIFYDMIISGSEKNIEMSADTSKFLETVKFKGSKENELLYNYRKFLKQKNDEVKQITAEMQSGKISQAEASAKMKKMHEEVKTNVKEANQKNPAMFVTKIINANADVEIPENTPILPSGKKDSVYIFNYYKNHFFDNIDFKDARMLNTPFLQTKIDDYYKNLVYQIPDSVIVDSDRLLAKTKANQEVYRYVLWQVNNKYEKSEVVGMEPVLVHLMEKYYLKDATWLDSAATAYFTQRVKTLKPILPGKIMPSLVLADTTGKAHNLMSIKADKTIVIFFAHDCGHCKESAPKIVDFANKNKGQGIEVVMVETSRDLGKIKEFIKTYKLENITTLYDKFQSYDFLREFDVYSTPTSYILDKDKKILAKRIPIDDFSKYLEFVAKNEKLKATGK